jgi:hypothetical protein
MQQSATTRVCDLSGGGLSQRAYLTLPVYSSSSSNAYYSSCSSNAVAQVVGYCTCTISAWLQRERHRWLRCQPCSVFAGMIVVSVLCDT